MQTAFTLTEARAEIRDAFSLVPAATDPEIFAECLTAEEQRTDDRGLVARAHYLIGLFDNSEGEISQDLEAAASVVEAHLAAAVSL